jgi:hypothetical protein
MAGKYIDLHFLMSSTKNDVEQVKEFIQDVLELNGDSISSLDSAFENKNFSEMKSIAHMLKSSADIFDSALYKEKLVNLEAKCKAGEEQSVAEALDELKKVAVVWETQLREELEKLS